MLPSAFKCWLAIGPRSRRNPFRAPAVRPIAFLSAALAALAQVGCLQAAEGPCPESAGTSAKVASVSERLELILEDGRRLKIAGIDPPRPTPGDPNLDARARNGLGQWLVGQDITFHAAEPALDRWGRIVAFVYAPPLPQQGESPSEPRLAVGEALIDAGLARYEPSAAAHPCRSALLAAEANARAARLGLWADPYYAIITAGERGSFTEKAGSLVIVEGTVTGIGSRRPRITLYLGPRRGLDFSVAILVRNKEAFEAAYSSLAGLKGKRIRVRGLLDIRFGPRIEISDLDAVEATGQEPAVAASPEPGQ